MHDFKDDIKVYFEQVITVICRLDVEELNAALNAIADAWERSADIYVFGNGGSAATASHMTNDFNKGISEMVGKKFRMHCLCDNFATVMAIANDISYDEVFCFQLEGVLREGDLIIGISGSGNSMNVIKAVEYAKSMGVKVIGITGYNGGRLKELADYHMDTGVDDMQITEDIHMIFDHMMMRVLGIRLKND
ncbi:SIS domain-containing protein [Desulfitobacterium hafniense]|uniref:SIS domain-containing protein n=1 Tax=Desulfitobacterium hafniense TaxID=49338 RepID=UPI000A820597|nr:SIS domain-containing protein [Desulfitobacterium hafniense]